MLASWHFRSRALTLDRPRVMAILNLTPDSFYDGGSLPTIDTALAAATHAVNAGADLLDVGGESTRPGAQRINVEDQIARVIPAIRAIRGRLNIPISIDTTLSAVASAAIDAGADIINDVSAGTEDPAMLPLAARTRAGLILMHRLAPPGSDSYSDRYTAPPTYTDVVLEVRTFLEARAAAAIAAGTPRESIVLDPGLGFGKTVEQNLDLIRRTPELAATGFPVLSALSRKSFVGRAAGLAESTPAQRLAPTLALSLAHRAAGAAIFRVHDAPEHIQAFRAFAALG